MTEQNTPDYEEIRNRVGRFKIARQLLFTDFAVARLIVSSSFVVRAEMLFHTDALEYIGLCKDFDEVPEGSECPTYRAVIKQEDEWTASFHWERVTGEME